jgi:hypothetical protein
MQKTRTFNLLAVVLLIAASLAMNASAYSEIGLQVTDPAGNAIGGVANPVEICPCTPITPEILKVRLTNLGTQADTPQISIEVPAGWTGQIQSSVGSMAPGESRTLDLLLIETPSCFVAPGKYQVTVNAKSGISGNNASQQINIGIIKCHFASITSDEAYKETCIESGNQTYELTVSNEGKFTETFALSSENQGVGFSQNEVTLAPEASETVTATVNALMLGLSNFKVFARSKSSYATAEQQLQLKVNKCFDAGLEIQPSQTSACIGKTVNFMLLISNTGSEEDSYTIYTPDWVVADTDTVTLDPKKGERVIMEVTPLQVGKNSFNVTIVSETRSEVAKTVTGVLDATECRDVVVIASPAEADVCQNEQAAFSVIVKNRGTAEETFTLSSTLGSFNETKVTLGPAGMAELVLTINAAGLKEGDYSVEIKASVNGISDVSKVRLRVRNCYGAELNIEPESQSVCFAGTADYAVKITNTGRASDTYIVSFGDHKEDVTLAPGASDTFPFAFDVPSDAGTYNLTATAVSGHASAMATAFLKVKNADNCISVSLADGDVIRVQPATAETAEIDIKNTGERNESFSLSVDSVNWVYVSPEAITLQPGEQGKGYLYVTPDFSTQTGVYRTEIKVTASNGLEVIKTVAVAVVANITGNETGQTNQTGNQTGGITGGITGGERPLWKTLVVAAITLVIIIILIVRFVFLVR